MRTAPTRLVLDFVYTFDGRWWTAEAPALPGGYSQGRTRASARKNLLAALRALLATYKSLGQLPPLGRVVRRGR